MSGISLGRVTTLLLFGRAAGYVLALANSVILARALGVDRLGTCAYAMRVTDHHGARRRGESFCSLPGCQS